MPSSRARSLRPSRAPSSAPPSSGGRVLVVDDDVTVLRSVERMLRGRGFDSVTVEDGHDALQHIRRGDIDLVLTDVFLRGDLDGFELLRAMRREQPDLEAIVMTGHDMSAHEVALQSGALDLLRKPFDHPRLLEALGTALARRRDVALQRRATPPPPDDDALVGESDPMRAVRQWIDVLSRRDTTVLVLGETGTGKELVAKSLHARSSRARGPFVAINCGAIHESLLESELFGHAKGAFTGAVSNGLGRFQRADGGVLFLDEVGDLSMSAQVKLLRALQERVVTPVGGAEERVDVRVVAATHRDLRAMVREKTFREDLYYRLAVVTVRTPPLRDRPSDIPALVDHVLHRQARRARESVPTVDPDAMAWLQAQRWPGNIRELENALERATLLSDGETIRRSALNDELETPGVHVDLEPLGARWDERWLELPYDEARERVMREFARFYADAQLARADGNVTRAAELARMDRSNFRRLRRDR